MKAFRRLWWYFKSAISRYYRRFLPVMLILAGLVMISPFVRSTLSPLYHEFISPVQKAVLTEGLVGSVKTLNPILATTDSERDIDQLVFRGLTKTDSRGDPVGDLARDFNVQNNKEYTFRLQDNVFWHDGEKFTADDVLYTVKIAQNSSFHSPFYETLKDAAVTKLSDFEVRFTLKEEFAPFLSLTNFGIIPEHIPLNKYKPVGTGRFSIVESKDDYVLLKGESFNLLFRYYATRDLALTALKLGEIQSLGGLSSSEAAEVNNWDNLKIYSQNLAQRYVGLFINGRNDKLQDKAVRQALQMSTPKADIIAFTTENKAQEATSSVPLNSWVPILSNTRYRYNPEEAKNLLERAGWKMGEGSYRTNEGRELAVTITTLDNRTYLEALEMLKESWGQIGIRVEKHTVSSNQLRDTVLPNHQFEILLNSQEIPADPDQYNLWHSTQIGVSNIVSLDSPKIDKVLEDGRQSLERDTRISRYQDFQRFLSDEAPVIFLYYPDYYYVVSNRVTGVDLQTLGLPKDRFRSVDKWVIGKKFF